ncbi:hypothetical protein M947_03130 [Sulfurimonas hongkongensis]|uniref:FAD/FMN-containing dehydrogenase n=1 Tax=Sulfurimonas hongkongensis TaxID=1172190 RepID=T0JPC1_9BACT|nr:hypothetical protein [Sulfurimonas hongkongensis]EQB40031.1 hypothetical protein M947_03130 [Sulfurimonas hongkongensis]
MKKIIVGLFVSIFFIGCSSTAAPEQAIEPKLVVGKSLSDVALSDQFEKVHKIEASTKKVIFAFSKDVAHTCNDFFVTQSPTYLSQNHTQFVADVSAAPSLIRSMFILPGLKDFKHTVLLLDDKKKAAPYRAEINNEQIVVVYIDDGLITKIKTIDSEDELKKVIEAK